jgi:hypothetical protein
VELGFAPKLQSNVEILRVERPSSLIKESAIGLCKEIRLLFSNGIRLDAFRCTRLV